MPAENRSPERFSLTIRRDWHGTSIMIDNETKRTAAIFIALLLIGAVLGWAIGTLVQMIA